MSRAIAGRRPTSGEMCYRSNLSKIGTTCLNQVARVADARVKTHGVSPARLMEIRLGAVTLGSLDEGQLWAGCANSPD